MKNKHLNAPVGPSHSEEADWSCDMKSFHSKNKYQKKNSKIYKDSFFIPGSFVQY